MLCILKAFCVWVALVLIGINLAGFIIRGLAWAAPTPEDVFDGLAPDDYVDKIIKDATRRMRITNAFVNLLTWAASAGYLFALYRYWGVGLALAGALLVLTRVPGLLWELRTGRKLSSENTPTGPLPTIATVVMFATLPLIWYSLCR
jgi:hypothetical protein